MIHHCVFCKLNPDVTGDQLESMIRATRSQLLKIGEALHVRSGKTVDPENDYPFFYSVDAESLAKLAMLQDDPVYVKFMVEVIEPHTYFRLVFNYETEPGRDIKYS